MPGDKAIAINHIVLHAEVLAAVAHKLVQLFKRSLIQQLRYAFARRKLALRRVGVPGVRVRRLLRRARGCSRTSSKRLRTHCLYH